MVMRAVVETVERSKLYKNERAYDISVPLAEKIATHFLNRHSFENYYEKKIQPKLDEFKRSLR